MCRLLGLFHSFLLALAYFVAVFWGIVILLPLLVCVHVYRLVEEVYE